MLCERECFFCSFHCSNHPFPPLAVSSVLFLGLLFLVCLWETRNAKRGVRGVSLCDAPTRPVPQTFCFPSIHLDIPQTLTISIDCMRASVCCKNSAAATRKERAAARKTQARLERLASARARQTRHAPLLLLLRQPSINEQTSLLVRFELVLLCDGVPSSPLSRCAINQSIHPCKITSIAARALSSHPISSTAPRASGGHTQHNNPLLIVWS